MIFLKNRFLLYCLTFSTFQDILATKDSITIRNRIIPITHTQNLSASYIHHKDWKYNGNNNYSFLLRSNINFDSISTTWETHSRLNCEIGYLKFVDSTWYKNADCLDLGLELVKRSSKTFENCFSFYFNSQILSTYETYRNDSGQYQTRWNSGFGNPMTIDLSYGATLHFWKSCRINLAFVTLKTSTLPLTETFDPEKNNEMIYHKTLIRSEYGVGLQTYIRKKFGNRVRWENYSRCFGNAINRTKFDLDFRNRFIIKIIKYLDLILDNRIRYTPYPPYKFQFRNELMLSFTFEKI